MQVQGHLIDGEWQTSAEVFERPNPSDTRRLSGRYAQADAAQVAEAVAAARRAFPAWSTGSVLERATLLQRVADGIEARREALALQLSTEEGKVLAEARAEVARARDVFRFFAGEVLRIPGERHEGLRAGSEVEVRREPLGVVALITPWNFPIAIPAWKLAPALAYGNCAVLKPSEWACGTAVMLAEIVAAAGVPRGVFNLVLGRGAQVGQALLDQPGVDAVSFTGSAAVGRRIAVHAAERLRRCQLEMGGKNPLVVLDDADLVQAVEVAAQGSFFSTGQRCTASSRLIVTGAIHDRFVAALAERLRGLRVGPALAPDSDIGPVVDAVQLQKDLDYIGIAQAEGGRLLCGGALVPRDTPGHFLPPTLFADTTPAMRLNREEVFGPVAGVIRVKDYDEALAVANDTPFGLSAGLCTGSLKYAAHFRRHAEAGMVMVNQPTAGVDFHVPFGGRKGSSLGPREQGRHAVDFYTVTKTAYVTP